MREVRHVVVRAAAALLVAFAVLAPLPALAHTLGLSTGEYRVHGSSVVATLAFARGEFARLVPGIDANLDGHLSAVEVASSRATIRDKVLARIVVTAGGVACPPVLTDAGLTEEDGLLVVGRWDCASAEAPFEIDVALLEDLTRGHRHIARSVTKTSIHDEVLSAEQRAFSIDPPAPVEATESDVSEAPPAGTTTSVGAFFVMGVEHILSGVDHLVFILGLVLVRARLRSLVAIVTAFTAAHSVSLALAVLDVWAPSPTLVEPAIALSIVYVGVENFFIKDASKRWRIAFPFGFVHGFGFAGALRELALAREALPVALVSFNVGVEAGQLAVLAVLLLLIGALRRSARFEPSGARLVSGAVAIAGCAWFISRVSDG